MNKSVFLLKKSVLLQDKDMAVFSFLQSFLHDVNSVESGFAEAYK